MMKPDVSSWKAFHEFYIDYWKTKEPEFKPYQQLQSFKSSLDGIFDKQIVLSESEVYKCIECLTYHNNIKSSTGEERLKLQSDFDNHRAIVRKCFDRIVSLYERAKNEADFMFVSVDKEKTLNGLVITV